MSTRRRLDEAFDRIRALEGAVAGAAPVSEVARLNEAFGRIGALEGAVAGAAPVSEVARLNEAFGRIAAVEATVAGAAPLSEVSRLDDAFGRIGALEAAVVGAAPVSEVARLNLAFDRLGLVERRIDSFLSERSVEIPWVLDRYGGEETVLEVGYAWAEERYLRALLGLGIPILVGVDMVLSQQPADNLGFAKVRGDVMALPFADETFDLVLCISTIEHIGRDNSIYGIEDMSEHADPDFMAVVELTRILKTGGRMLLTVPFGRYEDQGWLINYDLERLTRLIAASGMDVGDQRYLELRSSWVEVEPRAVRHRGYRSLGAPHAGAVAMVELIKT